MAKINTEVLKFIKSYKCDKGEFWKVVVPDGRGGQIRKQGFLTKSDATNFAAAEYLKTLANTRGVTTIASSLLFRDYCQSWLKDKSYNGLAESTVMRYDEELRSRLIPYFGPFKMKELEKNHLRSFIRHMQEKALSSSMIYRAVATFKSIIRKAEIDDVIVYKGITTIETPKKNTYKAKFWDQQQVNFFLNATRENRHHDIWKFALFSGLRAGEIAGLKFDCVHFDKSIGSYQGAIEVKRIYNQKTRKIEETTKNGESRLVPILPEVREILLKQRQTTTSDFVFGGNNYLESSHFNRQLQSALKKLPQLPRIPFHGLRHSFCSYLDSTGMHRRIVSQIMGHKDLNTTNLYSHVNDQMLGLEMSRWLQNQNQQKTNNLQVLNF